MFGPAYSKNLPLEVMLRYLNSGITKIDTLRQALYFYDEKTFIVCLKEAIENGIISINLNNRTLFMSKKIRHVIDFIEEYDFINEIQKHQLDKNYIIPENLALCLKQVNYFNKTFNLSSTLNSCMKERYENDYSSEISKFNFYVKHNTNKNQPLLEM